MRGQQTEVIRRAISAACEAGDLKPVEDHEIFF